jgi:hypothetical protein
MILVCDECLKVFIHAQTVLCEQYDSMSQFFFFPKWKMNGKESTTTAQGRTQRLSVPVLAAALAALASINLQLTLPRHVVVLMSQQGTPVIPELHVGLLQLRTHSTRCYTTTSDTLHHGGKTFSGNKSPTHLLVCTAC